VNCGVDQFAGSCDHSVRESMCRVGLGLHSRPLPLINTYVSVSAKHSAAAVHVCRKAQAAVKISEQIISFY